MTVTFSTTDKVAQANGIKIVVYGKSGAGKTTLLSTAPNPLIICAEPGLLALRKHKIPVASVTTIIDLKQIITWCRDEVSGFERTRTICVDSLSEIAEYSLLGWKALKKDGRQIYGEMIEEMVPIIKDFRDKIPHNVVFTCKQDLNKDEMSGAMIYGPSLPGKELGKQLPYLLDEVFYMGIAKDNTGKDFRYLRTAPDMQYEAKDRSGALATFEQPDLSAIFAKIKEA